MCVGFTLPNFINCIDILFFIIFAGFQPDTSMVSRSHIQGLLSLLRLLVQRSRSSSKRLLLQPILDFP